MADYGELIALNNEAVSLITQPDTPLDDQAADSVMRNTVYIIDRLMVTPSTLTRLGGPCVDSVVAAAAEAQVLAPTNSKNINDLERHSIEGAAEYMLQTFVYLPLSRLQQKLYLGDYDHTDEAYMRRLKAAIALGGKAFQAILEQSPYNSELIDAQGHFLENTRDALSRVKPGSET